MTLKEFVDNLVSAHKDYWLSPDFQEIPFPDSGCLVNEINYISILYFSDNNVNSFINDGNITDLKKYFKEKYDELKDKYWVNIINIDIRHPNMFLDSLKKNFEEMYEYHQKNSSLDHARKISLQHCDIPTIKRGLKTYQCEENLLNDYYPSIKENDFRGIIRLYDTIELLRSLIKSLDIYKIYNKPNIK